MKLETASRLILLAQQNSMTVCGLPLTIEYPKGSTRELKNDEGKTVYKKYMYSHYGYINNAKGRDGDGVDCMVGPITDPKEIFVVHMRDMGPDKDEREDEDKVMIGYENADAAKQAFLLHYPANFYQSMTILPVDEFKRRLAQTQQKYTHNMLHAVGTPEGAEKAWDTRGRGRHPEISHVYNKGVLVRVRTPHGDIEKETRRSVGKTGGGVRWVARHQGADYRSLSPEGAVEWLYDRVAKSKTLHAEKNNAGTAKS